MQMSKKNSQNLKLSPNSVNILSSQLIQSSQQIYKNKCILHNQPITSLCLSKICTLKNITMCNTQQCLSRHQHPIREIITIQKLEKLLKNAYYNFQITTSHIKQYFKDVRQQIRKKLQHDEQMLLYLVKRLEYCSSEETYKTVQQFKQKTFQKLTNQRLKKLIVDIEAKDRRQEMMNRANFYQNQIKNMKIKLQELFRSNSYQNLVLMQKFKKPQLNKNLFEIQGEKSSKIITKQQQKKKIYQLLSQAGIFMPNKKFTLLFRASQYNFNGKKYHQIVNNQAPTLTIIKTSKNYIFGAYLACKIHSQKNWIADPTGKSFIFSLNHNSINKLKKDPQSKNKAAYGGLIGPQIGSGCDIYISDKCNIVKQSGSSLGGSYELGEELKYRSVQSEQYLGGERNFIVQEYEVLKID